MQAFIQCTPGNLVVILFDEHRAKIGILVINLHCYIKIWGE